MSVLTTMQEQLQQINELIAQLKRKATESPRPSIFANIRSLEKEHRNLQRNLDKLKTNKHERNRSLSAGRCTPSKSGF